MSQCKSCGVLLPPSKKPGRPPEHCIDCEINRNRDKQSTYDNKSNKLVGNPKQDIAILKFLHRKNKNIDKRYKS